MTMKSGKIKVGQVGEWVIFKAVDRGVWLLGAVKVGCMSHGTKLHLHACLIPAITLFKQKPPSVTTPYIGIHV
jgi:hypothetical protein